MMPVPFGGLDICRAGAKAPAYKCFSETARPVTDAKTRLQKYSAPALEKGLDIIELLALASDRGLSQMDIAEGLGRSKNEIFRMMVVLEERGYIHRSVGDTFQLTEKLADMIGPSNDMARMVKAARPYLGGLAQKTTLSNHLWVLKETQMQVAASTRAEGSYNLALSEGATGHMFGTSAGACFLAGYPDAATRIDALNRVGEGMSASDYDSFDQQVEQSRTDGVSALPNREMPGILEVSAPLDMTEAGGVIGVVTIPMIDTGASRNEVSGVIDALKETVGQIRSRLAFLSIYQPTI